MKRIAFFICFAWCSTLLFAQPKPCAKPEKMTSTCAEACVVCDINGFTGRNDSNIGGQAPPGFCTNTVHHMQWIAFIAGSPNLTLALKVFGCQLGDGLEVGIYETFDCKNFKLVSNCDTDVPNNTTQNFTNTTPLTVGQYYYWVMDGNKNDICNYTITVINGTTKVNELPNSGTIKGETFVCAGTAENYTAQIPPGASRFVWTLNGAPYANVKDTTVTIKWDTPGNFDLCVTASNACDTAAPSCRNIFVKKIPPTLFNATICEGECYEIADTMLCKSGTYDLVFPGSDGCDSLVQVKVEQLKSQSTQLDLKICKGDSVVIGNKAFKTTGDFQMLLQTQQACDSTVNLKLFVIECEIKGGLKATPALCYGSATGSLEFQVQNGTPPFKYNWAELGSTTNIGSGTLNALNTPLSIQKLTAGAYYVTISDNFGNDVVLSGVVTEPSALMASTSLSDYNGVNVRCRGDKDGAIQVTSSGGAPGYRYAWSSGQSTQNLSGIGAGNYTCTITDQNACTRVLSAEIKEPLPFELSVRFEQPSCLGIQTGAASVISTAGGTPPYLFDFQGNGFGKQTSFQQLLPGTYTLVAKDANGCTNSQSALLKTPLIPEIDLGDDKTVELGDLIRINLTQNIALDSFSWQKQPGLSCYNCPEPEIQALRSTHYVLTVTAEGGCTDVDSIFIKVKDRRNIYFPNIFKPDDNGKNDFFTGFGGPEALLIRSLKVYTRWGELVYEGRDLTPGAITEGWNGRIRGRDAHAGVYTWVAQVEFIDGLVVAFDGTVTVIR